LYAKLSNLVKLIALTQLLIGLTVTTPALGKIVMQPLEDMVSGADVIFIGNVLALENSDITDKNLGPKYYALLRIDKIVKGSLPASTVKVDYYTKYTGEPNFVVGETCLLFVERHKGGYHTYWGYGGKAVIKDGKVTDLFIIGEVEETLPTFINKIRAIMSIQKHQRKIPHLSK